MTAAAEAALSAEPAPAVGRSSATATSAPRRRACSPLVEAVEAGECDLAVAAFSRRVGGGFGLALGFARWAIRRLCGLETAAPISGQRAMRVEALRATLPFARGYGMEIGMTVDAVRAGYRLREYELDLEHRATGRDLARLHPPGRQLADFARAYLARPAVGLAEGRQHEFDDLGRQLGQLLAAALGDLVLDHRPGPARDRFQDHRAAPRRPPAPPGGRRRR